MDAGRYTTHRVSGAGTPGLSPAEDEATLALRFGDRIRHFALRHLGNMADAEDVSQETLRRVMEALRADRVRDPHALPGFVYQTAWHIVLQKHRSARRESRTLRRLHGGGRERAGRGDPLASLMRGERRRSLRTALEVLADPHQALLRRLYYDGETTADAARRLSITPAALRVRKHRALRALRALLGERPENRL